jgi:hypothetical protein
LAAGIKISSKIGDAANEFACTGTYIKNNQKWLALVQRYEKLEQCR